MDRPRAGVLVVTGVFSEGQSPEDHLAAMRAEGQRLRRLGAHTAIAAAIPKAAAAHDWSLLSLLLQALSILCILHGSDAAFAEALAAPLADGTTTVQRLFALISDTQDQIPRGFPFKKVPPGGRTGDGGACFDPATDVAAVRTGPGRRMQAVLALRHVLVVVWGSQDTMARLVDVARAEAGLPPRPTSTASAAMGRRAARHRTNAGPRSPVGRATCRRGVQVVAAGRGGL